MNINFKNLLILKISHAYYDGDCRDFDYFMPFRTKQVLRDGRLTAKVRDGLLYIFFDATASGEALVSLAGQQFCFGIKLLNPYFANFTQLDFDMKTATPVYRNSPDIKKLAGGMTAILAGPVFSHTISDANRPLTVSLVSSEGRIVYTESIPAGDNRKTVFFDITGQASGVYIVREDSGGPETKTLYYVAADFVQAGILGIVEITLDNSFYGSPPTFAISFQAKKDFLKYYLVTRKFTEAEFNQLVISDQGFTKDERPEILFKELGLADFTPDDIDPQFWGNSDTRIKLFKSKTEVPRQEKARRHIQLAKNSDVLIENLPQPGTDKVKGDIIIHLSKP